MRILFLSSWFPYPPINGAKIRIYNLVRALAKDHEITMLAFARSIPIEDALRHVPIMEQYCRSVDVVAAKPFTSSNIAALRGILSSTPRSVAETVSPEMENLLDQRLAEGPYDAVIASEVGAPATVSLLASTIPGVPKVLDALEIGLARDAYYREKDPARRLRRRMTWMKLRGFTKEMLGHVDACTVPSLEEHRYLSELASGNTMVELIPHSLDLAYYSEPYPQPVPASLVFTGSFTYHANADAAIYFLEEIYPLVEAGSANVQMKVLGSTADVDIDSLAAGSRVEFAGLIKDVRPQIAQSWLSVVPLRVGAGTRLKIIESMALGTPVISTSKGAEGLDVIHGENILIADTPQDFAREILRVIHDPQLRMHLSGQGRKLVSEKYNAEVMGRNVEALLQRISQKDHSLAEVV